ncbi:MAG: acetyl-CoA carboxylase carboxyl transferase subunit alpha [Candidatus Rokuibacteriota bacterium]|nr:MAG: acetyl-CoA carboxylase carboxyl transferase subunit alpha [Candidatus Rokubacteria bacterium]
MLDELEFEKPLQELENRIIQLRASDDPGAVRDEIAKLEERLGRLQQRIYGNLTAWQRAQVARHPKRPHALDFFQLLLEDFVELRGDRVFGDDKAIVGGLARFEGEPVVVVGHQKGRDTRENIARNFGMPHPEGYRKALRLMQLGAKFRTPIITFIDTPGAYPGLGAEERGQAEAIARNLKEMAGLATPIVCVVAGEGGSGGALAIGVGNRVLMLEHAIYSVISPEGCAAILWADAAKAPEAAQLMRVTAADLLRLGAIDAIVREPAGGAHRNWAETAATLRVALRDHLWELRSKSGEELVEERYDRFRRIGVFEES